MFIDSHCHLLDAPLDKKIDALMQAAAEYQIEHLVSIAPVSALDRQNSLKQKYPMMVSAIGIHPLFINEHTQDDLSLLENACRQKRVSVIGEIGLDFYIPDHHKEKQLSVFEQQLKIAQQFNLPVILHLRKSVELATLTLKKYPSVRGVAHAFSGSLEQAHLLVKMGFKIGLGGTITYEGSKKIRAIAAALPDHAIVLETDAPYMPPCWLSKKPNSPLEIPAIAQVLATLRNSSLEAVARITTANTKEVLGLL